MSNKFKFPLGKQETKSDTEPVKTNLEEETVKSTVEMTHVALGTYKSAKDGKWYIAEIPYNAETLQASSIVTQVDPTPGDSSNYRDAVIDKFKILAVEKGLVG